MKACVRALAAVVVLALVAPARADDKTDAQALFDEGLKLFDQKNYAAACPKFAASQKADPAAGTLLNLARCYEADGRLASAQQAYVDAIAQAKKERDKPREALARKKEAEVASSVPHLTIVTSQRDVRVERDGTPLGPAVLGVPVPVDAGAHQIVATANGKKPFTTSVTVANGETKELSIPALEDEQAPAPKSPPAAHATPQSTEPAPAPSGLGTRRLISLAVGGAGVVALGVGAFFALRASSLKSDANPHCFGDNTCDADGLSLLHRAGSAADVSTTFVVAGGVLVAGGVALWLSAPSPSAKGTSATLSVGPTGGLLRVVY